MIIMSHGFTSRLRRFGAGTAAILLIAGAAACGGGSESAERGDGKMKSMLGGGEGNRSSDRGGDERRNSDRNGGERGNGESGNSVRSGGEVAGGETVRMGSGQTQGRADNYDRRVRIVNNSSQTISFLKGSPTSDNDWGRDRIPTLTLSARQSTIVDFNDNNGECRYDLQATFQDGSTREQRDVNICQVSEWIVTGDGASAR
jgi:hypothetical protein